MAAASNPTPLDILRDFDQRAARLGVTESAEPAEQDERWLGIAFRIDESPLVTPASDVVEVLNCPPLTPIPGTPSWLRGVASYRDEPLPVVDMRGYLCGSATRQTRDSRVLAVAAGSTPVGFLVARVLGVMRFAAAERSVDTAAVRDGLHTCLVGSFVNAEGTWSIVDFRAVIESSNFSAAASEATPEGGSVASRPQV